MHGNVDWNAIVSSWGQGFAKFKEDNEGNVDIQQLARSLFMFSDASTIDKAVSIFNKAAMSDGKAELLQEEFMNAVKSAEFIELLQNHSKKLQNYWLEAKNPSEPKRMPDGSVSLAGTPRDNVVANEGEWFANKIWDPMTRLAEEALEYMKNNHGSIEKFSFTGMPFGVTLISVSPAINYMNADNDVMSIVDGQPQVTRHADFVQAEVLFEFNGQPYRILSSCTDDLEPFGNPSYNEPRESLSGEPSESYLPEEQYGADTITQ